MTKLSQIAIKEKLDRIKFGEEFRERFRELRKSDFKKNNANYMRERRLVNPRYTAMANSYDYFRKYKTNPTRLRRKIEALLWYAYYLERRLVEGQKFKVRERI